MELRQQRSLGAGKNHVESGNGHNPGEKKKKKGKYKFTQWELLTRFWRQPEGPTINQM